MSKKLRGNLMLLLAAFIWGSTFVFQSAAMKYVEPFTFNACRSYVGFVVLAPTVTVFRSVRRKEGLVSPKDYGEINRNSIIAGIGCGLALVIASSFQQIGISLTTSGKAGFITAIYIIMVPILSIFLGHKIPKIIWLCALLSLSGFYFLCIREGFTINPGDIYCLICAFCFSIQIMLIDHYTKMDWKMDPVMMSMVEFLVVAVISTILMFIFEAPTIPSILEAGFPIFYAGALSSGIAYTLQILGQRDTSPETAPLIMSLESVFAALFGWLILGEVMSIKELFGCALVFISVILSQLPDRKTKEQILGN